MTHKRSHQKKIKLGVHNKRTKWAPFWAVLRKFGPGKRVHPSQMTAQRRHWRRVALKVGPRKTLNHHLG